MKKKLRDLKSITLVISAMTIIALSGCAHAATAQSPPAAAITASVAAPSAAITTTDQSTAATVVPASITSAPLAFAVTDLQNALTIYQQAGDVAGADCITEILKYQPQLSALTSLNVTGAFSAFAAARVRAEAIKRGIPESVHIKCAPLVVDANTVLLRLHQ